MADDNVLKIQIQAATQGLKEGIDKASSDVKGATTKMEDNAKKTTHAFHGLSSGLKALGIGAAAVFATKKIADAIGHVASVGEQLQIMSEQTGMTVRQLSELKYVAEQSDISFTSLQEGLNRLSSNMGQLTTPTSRMALALKSLGISATNSQGQTLTMSQLLPEIANKFHNTADGVNKTEIAMSLFGGRLGAQMIPLLDKGSKSIAMMEQHARALGVTIGTKAANADVKFEETLRKAKAVVEGLFTRVANDLIPSLTKLVKAVIDNRMIMGTLEIVFKAVAFAVKLVVKIVDQFAAGFEATAGTVKTRGDTIKIIFQMLTQALKYFGATANIVGRIIGAAFDIIKRNVSAVISAIIDAIHGRFSAAWHDVSSAIVKDGNTISSTYEGVKSVILDTAEAAKTAAKTSVPGMTSGSMGKQQLESIAQITNAERKQTEEIRKNLQESKRAAREKDQLAKREEEMLRKKAQIEQRLEERQYKLRQKTLDKEMSQTMSFLNQTLSGRMRTYQIEQKLEQTGLVWFENMLRKELVSFITNELLKTNALQTAQMQRLASQKVASSQGLAQQGATLTQGIASDSAKTFSGVYSALAGIPIVGPALAAVAAPAAEALVAGKAANVVSAAGGYDVPSDTFAKIHAREMVLPADLSEGIRAMTRSGSKTGSSMPNVHIHAMDHEDVMRTFVNNRDAVTSAMLASARDYATRRNHALRTRP